MKFFIRERDHEKKTVVRINWLVYLGNWIFDQSKSFHNENNYRRFYYYRFLLAPGRSLFGII